MYVPGSNHQRNVTVFQSSLAQVLKCFGRKEEEQNSSRKRKSDELVALKSKRKRTELDIDLLVKSADEMVEKAVKASAKEAHELIVKSLAMKSDASKKKKGPRIPLFSHSRERSRVDAVMLTKLKLLHSVNSCYRED
ncbi:hypothetical protein PoB_000233200 [Plakobranchus ocellatus]|uniref:Uncharacterized protein n=1 Tax=Plakobranchus ocellatus TaxID=259542 RepID=A0AAV3XZB5_9GAST|nr:hypothetical protein PoB_000233200 [Plakobranchus ocellatus]